MERDTFLATLRELNDNFRRTFIGGAIIVSPRFEALDAEVKSDILWRVRNFDAFEPNEELDPENEHAYLALNYRGCHIVALIVTGAWTNPAPTPTTRQTLPSPGAF